MKRFLTLGIVLAISLVGTASEEEKNPHLWEPHTTSVAVFKNGLGFFFREGDVELREGWCSAGQMPPAAFGTLAFFSHQEGEIVDIVGAGPGEMVAFDDRDAPSDPAEKRSRLEAHLNLKASLNYSHEGREKSAAGKIVSVGEDYVILQGENNTFAVPISGIETMQVLELPVRIHVSGEEEGAPQKTRLGMAYLRKGISWIPEYTLNILDGETAELSLRGTLVNEAEDLIHCDVNFVVGVPHFIHTDYHAPLTAGQVIRTIGTAVAPSALQTQISNNAFFNTSPSATGGIVVERSLPADNGDLSKTLGNLPQMQGNASADYTVYTREDLTLRRGEKAVVTLFVKRIRYEHLYRWTPPGKMKHLLVLVNDTHTAWTTGSCLAIEGRQPLSEDLLKYTPKGGRAEIPVTTAINIAHQQKESEIERQLKAHSPARDVFLDLVTLEGGILLTNYEKKKARLEIAASIPGKPLSASLEGELFVDTKKLKLLERQGKIHWSLELEPGERKSLNYRYERYVPSH